MLKYRNSPVDQFRSKLEKTAATLLGEAEIEFEYEPWEVVLLDPFQVEFLSYERIGKNFKQQSKRVRSIKYIPDFVGRGWIMETKGKKTADFQIKWKLFKRYLIDNDMSFVLFMPTNKKEIITSIEIIKTLI